MSKQKDSDAISVIDMVSPSENPKKTTHTQDNIPKDEAYTTEANEKSIRRRKLKQRRRPKRMT